MKPFPRVFLALALSGGAALWLRADDGVLPKGPPAARYDAMASRSPFTVPTAPPSATPPPAVAQGPHWWEQMFLTSLMERGGVYYVGLVDKASSKHYLLAAGKADQDSQLLLSEVHWNDRLDQTTATVSKGVETAPPIRFDASAVSVPPVAQGPPSPYSPSGPRPLPNSLPPTLPPGFSGTPPPPPPTGNPVVRRIAPIASRPLVAPQNPSQQPPSGQPRRIVVPNSDDN